MSTKPHRVFLLMPMLITAAGHAGTLYSNITSSFPTTSPGRYSNGLPVIGTTFIATGSGTLSQLALGVFDANSVVVTGGLYTNSGGEPGTLLESWTFAVPLTDSLTTLDSVVHPSISAGTRYWFAFTSFPFDFSFWWDQNDQHVTGGEFSSFDLASLGTGVSSVDGLTPGIELTSAVPEPSSLGLVGVACAGLIGLHRLLRSGRGQGRFHSLSWLVSQY